MLEQVIYLHLKELGISSRATANKVFIKHLNNEFFDDYMMATLDENGLVLVIPGTLSLTPVGAVAALKKALLTMEAITQN